MTQVTRTTFKSSTASLFADNDTGDIGANDLRAQMDNIADSATFKKTGFTVAPTVNDDGTDTAGNGAFDVGDVWVDEVASNIYVCADNTTSAAIWNVIPSISENERSFSDFGCRGDGSTNTTDMTAETAAYQAAMSWAAGHTGRRLYGDLDAVYMLNNTVSIYGSIDIDYRQARTTFNADVPGIIFYATPNDVRSIGADYSAGDLSISLTGNALSTVPKPGSIGRIISNATDPYGRDRGDQANQYRVGESFIVGVGSTTTNIILARPLRFISGVNPTSTAGDEAAVDSYTVANNARITIMSEEPVNVVNGYFDYIDGNENVPWNSAKVISVQGHVRPIFSGLVFNRSYDAQLRLVGTYGAVVSNCSFNRGENDTPNSQLGYGISDGGVSTKVYACSGNDCRHVYTTGQVQTTADTTDYYDVVGGGRTVSPIIQAGHATGGVNAAWDTHADADGASFSNIRIENSESRSIALRGRFSTVGDLTSRNCKFGAYVFTEYASGQGATDDLYNNRKDEDSFTSATIFDVDIDCDELPLENLHARLWISGTNKIVCRDHVFCNTKGGTTRISGSTVMTSVSAASVDHSHTGIFTIAEPNQYAVAGCPNNGMVVIEAGASVIIDARQANAATIKAFSIEATSSLIVKGELKIQLPAGATLGDSDRVSCEDDGRIEISVEGAEDDTLVSGPDDLEGLNIYASDGSFWWKDPVLTTNAKLKSQQMFLSYNDSLISASHTGDTALTELYVPNGQYAARHMKNDGYGSMRMRLWGTKNGNAGTATIRLQGNNGNFVDSIDLSNEATIFEVDVTVMFYNTSEQLYRGNVYYFENSSTTGYVGMMRSEENFNFTHDERPAFELRVQLENAADTVSIEAAEIWTTRGGAIGL